MSSLNHTDESKGALPKIGVLGSKLVTKFSRTEKKGSWNFSPHRQLEEFRGDVKMEGAVTNWLPDSEEIQYLLDQKIPLVRVGHGPHPMDDKIKAVLPDQEHAGERGSDFFSTGNFSQVAFLGSDPWRVFEPLYDGFFKGCQDKGIDCYLYQEVSPEKGMVANQAISKARFCAWLELVPKPLGILTVGISRTKKYREWILESGLSIPDDVTFLTVTDTPNEVEAIDLSVSELSLGFEKRFYRACELIDASLKGKPLDRDPTFLACSSIIDRYSKGR